MIRTHIQLTEQQARALNELAATNGVSVDELIRLATFQMRSDEVLATHNAQSMCSGRCVKPSRRVDITRLRLLVQLVPMQAVGELEG
jgi:hypothetical protein